MRGFISYLPSSMAAGGLHEGQNNFEITVK
jgi:hypothetical protein